MRLQMHTAVRAATDCKTFGFNLKLHRLNSGHCARS